MSLVCDVWVRGGVGVVVRAGRKPPMDLVVRVLVFGGVQVGGGRGGDLWCTDSLVGL